MWGFSKEKVGMLAAVCTFSSQMATAKSAIFHLLVLFLAYCYKNYKFLPKIGTFGLFFDVDNL
jgi:hypothetical protein